MPARSDGGGRQARTMHLPGVHGESRAGIELCCRQSIAR